METYVFLPKVSDEQALHELQESGVVRATATFLTGPYQGMAVISEQDLEATMRTLAMVCPLALAGCIPLAGGSGTNTGSRGLPQPYMAWIELVLRFGEIADYLERLPGLALPDGVRLLHTPVLGGTSHVVVEVLGDSLATVHEAVLAVVDQPAVASAAVMHTTASLTRGFGTRGRGGDG